MANELNTNAAVRYQNPLDPTAASAATVPSANADGGPLGGNGDESRLPGAGRRKSPCSGTVVQPSTTASVSSASRQPNASINQFDSGEKTKLAKPPTSVTTV